MITVRTLVKKLPNAVCCRKKWRYHMVNFFSVFVKCAPNVTLSNVAEHFHYPKSMTGADYVGVGGDFDGVNRVPRGLEDVSKYPELFAELLRSGKWNLQVLKNLTGLNILRVMRQVEKVSYYMKFT